MAATGAIATHAPADEHTQPLSVLRRALPTLVMAIYLVLGLVAYWPVLPGMSHRLFGGTSDYVLSA
jgi:hypothetical protein